MGNQSHDWDIWTDRHGRWWRRTETGWQYKVPDGAWTDYDPTHPPARPGPLRRP